MEELKEQFRKNGLKYTLLARSKYVALFQLNIEFPDKTTELAGFEVSRIKVKNDKFGHRETIPSNEVFGKDGSSAFSPDELRSAEEYFRRFSEALEVKRRKNKPIL